MKICIFITNTYVLWLHFAGFILIQSNIFWNMVMTNEFVVRKRELMETCQVKFVTPA